jgi:hypothetical protein
MLYFFSFTAGNINSWAEKLEAAKKKEGVKKMQGKRRALGEQRKIWERKNKGLNDE